MLGVRPLVLIGFISAFMLVIYYTFSPSVAYPVQDVTKEQAVGAVQAFIQDYELDTRLVETSPQIETQANESIGRYVQQEDWTTEEIEDASKRIPFFEIVLSYGMTFFYLDPLSNEVIGADGIEIYFENENQLDELVHQLYGPTFWKEGVVER